MAVLIPQPTYNSAQSPNVQEGVTLRLGKTGLHANLYQFQNVCRPLQQILAFNLIFISIWNRKYFDGTSKWVVVFLVLGIPDPLWAWQHYALTPWLTVTIPIVQCLLFGEDDLQWRPYYLTLCLSDVTNLVVVCVQNKLNIIVMEGGVYSLLMGKNFNIRGRLVSCVYCGSVVVRGSIDPNSHYSVILCVCVSCDPLLCLGAVNEAVCLTWLVPGLCDSPPGFPEIILLAGGGVGSEYFWYEHWRALCWESPDMTNTSALVTLGKWGEQWLTIQSNGCGEATVWL